MRMRKKTNLDSRLDRAGSVLLNDPESFRGRWKKEFPGHKELAVELGCGKGRFTADTAEAEPDLFIAAVERVPEATVVGMERVTRRGLNNVRFLDMDAANICKVFAPGEADRIYINFCDPWPSNGHAKRRLTAPDFLTLYRTVLKPGGELRFKTDNVPLFDWSVEQFRRCGWEIIFETHDLHHDGVCEIMTDYEAKFHSQGVPICKCIARTPLKAERVMTIEEVRPRGVLCLPEIPEDSKPTAAQRAMLNTAKSASESDGLISIGWLIADENGSFTVDENEICSAILADSLDEAAVSRLLCTGAAPERLPGGRYAVFETEDFSFKLGWKEMMDTLTLRGYCVDEPKPVIWRLSAARLNESRCEVCIPVRNPF